MGVTSGVIFLEWGNLPPVGGIPQARATGCGRFRDLVMAVRWDATRKGEETELQHSATICGG
jgi:hypothetical protein